MKINVIIAAGGVSSRYGANNKLFEPLGASCVALEATRAFLGIENVTRVIVAISADLENTLRDKIAQYGVFDSRIMTVTGGSSRTRTVKRAIEFVEKDADYVIIHDGARPFVSTQLINDVIREAKETGACAPLVPLTDSLMALTDMGMTPCDRSRFRGVQTPFCVRKDWAVNAYENAEKDFYDDISAIKTLDNANIAYIDGDPANRKITYAGDLIKSQRRSAVGIGYDIHRLTEGNGLPLMGVTVPCEFAFIAHSDGDVPIHAIMDAMLSAMGEKDIGHFFPVDDPKYDGIESTKLLETVCGMLSNRGLCVGNVSVAIIAERPKLAPYVDSMRKRVAELLEIPCKDVGVTVTTNEGVGELGESKAIAAYATVTLFYNN